MVAPKTRLQQHTAAEVAQMTPEQAMDVRTGTASYQRQVPEQTMLDIQRHTGGGVLSNATEHVGDLTHRMNQGLGTNVAVGDVMPKVNSQSNNLGSRYGFTREHGENMRENARYRGTPEGEMIQTTEHLGRKYAAEHRATPVYNYPTEVAVKAASSLGEGRFGETLGHLQHLQTMQFGGKHGSEGYAEGDMGGLLSGSRHRPDTFPSHQQGMVDYLRGREADTPAITRAATTLLGGRN